MQETADSPFSRAEGRATQLCKVDLLAIQADQVRVVAEIEESAFKPTIVCGKFLTSALATHYRHKSLEGGEVPLDRVLFIQVMKTGHLKPTSKKLKQYETIEAAIQNGLGRNGPAVVSYRIFRMKDENDQAVLDEIRDVVKSHLAAVPGPAAAPSPPA